MGSPYVPIKKNRINEILKQANLKPNKKFIDLGCGDGRVVQQAVQLYKVKGTGIDINPIVLLKAKFIAKIKKISNINYKRGNIFKTNLNEYDYIYLFLMPKLINELENKLNNALKNNSTIISHGFKIEYMTKYLNKKINNITFPTYIYKK
jgi:SAM-dependent methyltransferase